MLFPHGALRFLWASPRLTLRRDWNTGEYEGRLARSIEANEDFTAWTLELRPGLTFGNGDPVTTDAVKFTLQRHQADGQARNQIRDEQLRRVITKCKNRRGQKPGGAGTCVGQWQCFVRPLLYQRRHPQRAGTKPIQRRQLSSRTGRSGTA